MTRYRLSEKERELLACLELDASLSIQSVAKRLRWRPHTAQYLSTKLQENGVFKRSAFIDIHRLGLRYCGVFLSVHGNAKQKQSMIAFLKESDRVGWFAELGSSYQYGLALVVRNPKDADDFLFDLMRKTQIKIYKKATAFRLHLADTPRLYLTPKSIGRAALEVSDGVELAKIDDLDRQILSILSQSTELSYRQMASKVGIAHTSFDLRVRKLQKAKVLVGATLEIDLRWLSRTSYKVLIFARGKDVTLSKELRRYAATHSLVSHYIECFGEWDYEMNVEVESAMELSTFSDNLQEKFGDRISDISVLSMLMVHKVSRYPIRA